MATEREQIACHEAAHAVVGYRLGFYPGVTTILPNHEAGSLGAAYREGPWGDERDSRFVVVLYAGLIAQRRCDATAESRWGARDEAKAAELLAMHPDLPAAPLRDRARMLVLEHWSEIEAVADALLENGVLRNGEVDLICEASTEGHDWRSRLEAHRRVRRQPEA